jgi:hypothetical protein
VQNQKLTAFEVALLQQVAVEYPALQEHMPHLTVRKRKFTGVGAYIYFDYDQENSGLKPFSSVDIVIAAPINIQMPKLKWGLAHEIMVTAGWVKCLELVTNGPEKWDGGMEGFTFLPI